MPELIYDNVRIQFLSEEVLRLEVRYGAYFTDRNTLWIPDRGAFEKAGKRLPESQSRSRENQGRQQSLVVREEATQEHSRPQRFLLPEKNCSTSEKKKYILQWDAEDLYLLVCKKDARKLRETYVCLTGRADMLRRLYWRIKKLSLV